MDAFIKVCVTETLARSRPNNHFRKLGWKNVIKVFNNLIGRNYQYKQLKINGVLLRRIDNFGIP